MKKLLLSIALLGASSIATAQDCSGGRYNSEIFTTVTSTLDVQYGSAMNQQGTAQVELTMDIYQPDGDTETDRPLIILAHGGSFIGGDKTQLATTCTELAKMGYVAATIKYRLLEITAIDFLNIGLEFQKEVVRAFHDMNAAIRFFKKSAIENGNPYGINHNLIMIGGVSAGAILANHSAYLDSEAKIPSELISYIADQGGLAGNSGNPGYNHDTKLVISLCGAIKDTSWIEAGDQPFVAVHNQTDNTVPNISGQPNVGIAIPVTLYGDSSIHKRNLNVGVPSSYMMVPSTGHCDFPSDYMDFVVDFVHDQICVQGLSIANNPNNVLMSIYPNPAKESFIIDIPANEWSWTVSITNLMSQKVYQDELVSGTNKLTIESNQFNAGIYMVNLHSTDGKTLSKKLVIR